MPNYLINYNIYGTIEVTAKDKESAKALVSKIQKHELMEHISDEIDTGSLEIGTIEKL